MSFSNTNIITNTFLRVEANQNADDHLGNLKDIMILAIEKAFADHKFAKDNNIVFNDDEFCEQILLSIVQLFGGKYIDDAYSVTFNDRKEVNLFSQIEELFQQKGKKIEKVWKNIPQKEFLHVIKSHNESILFFIRKDIEGNSYTILGQSEDIDKMNTFLKHRGFLLKDEYFV